jgi:hypothetical protein
MTPAKAGSSKNNPNANTTLTAVTETACRTAGICLVEQEFNMVASCELGTRQPTDPLD